MAFIANTLSYRTGASGYIGGDFLHQLLESHPEYKVRALLRDAAKGAAVTRAFAQVEVVSGSLDDVNIIAQEAKGADVVVRKFTRNRAVGYPQTDNS